MRVKFEMSTFIRFRDRKMGPKFKSGSRNPDHVLLASWLRGAVVERRSLTSELSLSCARPTCTADGCPLMWVNRPL